LRAPASDDRGPRRALTLYVGTSGWAYPEWRGALYPEKLPQARFLEHYAMHFTACEVNATFYRIQPASVLERWSATVPDEFRFSVKIHRRLTYRKQLAPDPGTEAFASEFLASLRPLGPKLGCLLIQVPEFRERDDAGLGRLLDLLPDGLPFACELQHPSWWTAEVALALAERGGTICLREEGNAAPATLPPGGPAYVRLKGMHYSNQAVGALRKLLEREADGRDVYVFARHKDVRPDDPHTGPGLALWLTEGT
jgi:uncharacterized protein YecE (DUF72 family)